MRKLRLILAALTAACLGVGGAYALTSTPTTVSACATTPAQTIAVNGTTVTVVPPATACQTVTVPTVTITSGVTTDGTPGVTCSAYASPGAGTAQALVNGLSSGQTGCLLPGTYTGDVTFPAGGVVLTSSDPTNQALVRGTLYVPPASQHVTISGLHVDGSGLRQAVAVQLFGSYSRLTGSDVFGGNTDHIGVQVGWKSQVVGVEVDHNQIHDFGIPSSQYDHGIYVDNATGTLVHDNYIEDNAGGYGIQLWTASENGHFFYNTLRGNGRASIIIAGDSSQGTPSSGNEFDHNVFDSPTDGNNVQYYWGGTPGGGNVVHDNVYWGGTLTSGPGITYSGNLNADPDTVSGYGVR